MIYNSQFFVAIIIVGNVIGFRRFSPSNHNQMNSDANTYQNQQAAYPQRLHDGHRNNQACPDKGYGANY